MTKQELDEIRARHDWFDTPGGIANPLAALKDVLADVARLLDHIAAQDRAIEAHKRDEAQRAEAEAQAYRNGQRAALEKLRHNRRERGIGLAQEY